MISRKVPRVIGGSAPRVDPPTSIIGSHIPTSVVGGEMTAGLPALQIARNESAVDAARLCSLANSVNGIAASRRKCWGTYSAGSYDDDPWVCTFVGHTSPNVTQLRYSLILAPGLNVDPANSPAFNWVKKELDTSTNPAGETVTTLPSINVTPRQAGSTLIGPSYWFTRTGTIAVDEQTTYAIELHQEDGANIIAATVWEPTEVALIFDASSGTWVDQRGIRVGERIVTTETSAFINTMDALRRRGSSSLFSWSDVEMQGQIYTGTNAANVLDASFSTWDATAPGWWVYPHYCGTLSSTNVPVMAWAYAQCESGATTPRLYFKTSDSVIVGGAGIIVTSTAGYYTIAGNLVSSETSQKVDLVQKSGDATHTITTYAAGMYQYVA